MKRRGSIMDIVAVIAIFTTAVMALFISSVVYHEFQVGYNNSIGNMTGAPITTREEQIFAKTTIGMNNLIAAIPLVTIGSGVAAIVFAFLIPSSPIFLVFSLLALGICITVSSVFSNVLWEFTNNATFSALLAANPLISQMIQHFPMIIGVLGLLIIIANYSRPSSGGWSG